MTKVLNSVINMKDKMKRILKQALLLCGAVWSVGAAWTAQGAAPKPNFVDGGYTYYYGTVEGNTPANPENVYGRIPAWVENYTPQAGQTNVAFFCYEDILSFDSSCVLMTDATYSTQKTGDATLGKINWKALDGVRRMCQNFGDRNSVDKGAGALTSTTVGTAYFRLGADLATAPCAALHLYCVGRNDAFYRLPRSDTYYVVPGTKLWFLHPANFLGSPWVDTANVPLTAAGQAYDSAGKWTWSLADNFDQFTITAEPSNTPILLRSQDNSRTVTVHVVPETFSFKSFDVRLDGLVTRKIGDILFDHGVVVSEDEIESVTASDGRITVDDVAKTLTMATYFFDDCEVTVTLKDRAGVVLLKITNEPGKFLPESVSKNGPEILKCTLTRIIIAADNQTAATGPKWIDYPNSRNVPSGYAYARHCPDAILYGGIRYTPCSAARHRGIYANGPYASFGGEDGQLQSGVVQDNLIVGWFEDAAGNKVVLPQVLFCDTQRRTDQYMRLGLGTDHILYTSGKLENKPYYGIRFDSSAGAWQGTLPDSCGYYMFWEALENDSDWEEWSVLANFDVKAVEVANIIREGAPGARNRFRADFVDAHGHTATNFFTVGNGEVYTVLASTNCTVTVREVETFGNIVSVKGAGELEFRRGEVLDDGGTNGNTRLTFLNEATARLHPEKIWIADHADAGPSKTHLAVALDFGGKTVSLTNWLAEARLRNTISLISNETVAGLEKNGKTPITEFRNGDGLQDATNGWIWITVPSPTTDTGARLAKIRIDKDESPYYDGVIRATQLAETFVHDTSSASDLYSFTNTAEKTVVTLLRKSRVQSIILVGGGGAGGSALGGGGGGGEVTIVDGTSLGVLDAGANLTIQVGAGGAAASAEVTVKPSNTGAVDPIWNRAGNNGGDTFVTLGETTYVALGGGGGGSYQSPKVDGVGSLGRGRSGANGGGSAGAESTAGGLAMAANGNAGGKSSTSARYGSGGGGGLSAVGGNGSQSQSGAGGEGVHLGLLGFSGVFGSGGGGGSDNDTTAGAGGTNAGSGGVYVAGGDASCLGGDAVPGFGGGGGGGAYVSDSLGYRGGRGGDGRVILVLQDATTVDATCQVDSVGFYAADVSTKIVSLAGVVNSVKVYLAYGKVGGPMGEYRLVAEQAAVGDTVTGRLASLVSSTDYVVRFKYVTADGRELVVDRGLRTAASPFEMAFEDEAIALAKTGADGSSLRVLDDGSYLVTLTNTTESARILAKDDMVLLQALVVGGGGGGGYGASAAGGGGGEVRIIDDAIELAHGTELTALIGSGGAAATGAWTIGTTGGTSTVTIGEASFAAIGGGGGASSDKSDGGDGANGGGATGGMKSSGTFTPGASTNGTGFGGGGTAKITGKAIWCGGGGGGAAEPGQTGYELGANAFSGRGGEGLAYGFGVEFDIYGSGGGAGNNNNGYAALTNGCGGVHAGEGGNANLAAALRTGRLGDDGFGAGGGGGSRYGSSTSYGGGRGGAGVVKLHLARKGAVPLTGASRVTDLGLPAATINAKVVALGTSAHATVSLVYAQRGGETVDCGVIGTDLAAGAVVTRRLTKLNVDTWYDYTLTFTGSSGETQTVKGAFKTWRAASPVCFEDDNLILLGRPDLDVFERLPSEEGSYLFRFTNPTQDVTLVVKDDLMLTDALLVGGGGAGGARTGGGGGGGGVLENPFEGGLAELAAGDVVSVVVGKGGASIGKSDWNVNENGGSSKLTLGGVDYVALGGGAGGSWNEMNGHAGANGGGGARLNGLGGEGSSLEPIGFAGGVASCKRKDGFDGITGGGAGAGGLGGNGWQDPEKASTAADANHAGDGGPGVWSSITGELLMYGAGGGGGADQYVVAGKGQPGAGDGGAYMAGPAGDGTDGLGGGGGGAGYNNGWAGRGGNGTVIIRLRTNLDAQPIFGTAKVAATSKGSALVTGKVVSLGEGVKEVGAVYYAVESTTAPKKPMLAAANIDPKYTKVKGVGPLKAGDAFSFKISGLEVGTQYKYTVLFVGGDVQQTVDGRFTTLLNTAEQVAVNEIMASNGDALLTANGKDGLDWIELRNDGDRPENVSGWYLSDNPDKAESKWKKIEGNAVIPAHGTLIVWADKDYKEFTADEPFVRTGLGKDGGSVFLANPLGEILSRIDYPEQIKDISYGPDTTGKLGYFDPSSPGVANGDNALNAPTPVVSFDVAHGYKTEAFTVGISCAGDETAAIHYTTNGAKPTLSSPLYEGRITVDRTTCIRAAVVDENSVLQNDTSATYIFVDDVLQQGTAAPTGLGFPASWSVNSHVMTYGFVDLPAEGTEDRARLLRGLTNSIATISFVADPKDLFDSKTGVYVNPSTSHNGQDWERKILVEQIDPTDANNGFTIPAGLRLRGAGSLTSSNPKHSFRLFFRGKYGAGSLKFPLFGDEGADEFDKVDLRTSQNYSWASSGIGGETFIHETFARDTQRDMGVYYTRSRYYNLYINGQYWGLYQTQERGDEDFAETYAGGKADDYDVIKTTSNGYKTEANAGNFDAWQQLWTLVVQQGVTGTYADNYMKIFGCNPDGTRNSDYPVLLNRDNLIAHTLNTHYMVDGDSPVSAWGGFPNNMYALRDRKDGKAKADGFFFLRHDAEHSMGTKNTPSYRGSYCRYDQDPTDRGNFTSFSGFNPNVINIKLCGNADYKMALADAFYKHCLKPGGALTDEKALARFRSRMAEIDDAIVCEACRWGRSNTKTRETWLKNCDECIYFITNRLTYMTRQYRNKGWYPSIDAPTITIVEGKATFTAANSDCSVYYTLDGSDPRTNGILAPPEGVALPSTGTTVIRARCKSNAAVWSAQDEAYYEGTGSSDETQVAKGVFKTRYTE